MVGHRPHLFNIKICDLSGSKVRLAIHESGRRKRNEIAIFWYDGFLPFQQNILWHSWQSGEFPHSQRRKRGGWTLDGGFFFLLFPPRALLTCLIEACIMAQPQKSNQIAATPMFNSHCPKSSQNLGITPGLKIRLTLAHPITSLARITISRNYVVSKSRAPSPLEWSFDLLVACPKKKKKRSLCVGRNTLTASSLGCNNAHSPPCFSTRRARIHSGKWLFSLNILANALIPCPSFSY